ncbi:MAG: Crp/Fnr family transcriptional regulator [Rubrobacter sp.]|nr:Crp/Fnr family transcriptional regulator [Rubrobacter sp.]
MLVNHPGARATTPAPEDFCLEDFERAGMRVIERRFGTRDEIFTPGDPDDRLYFLLEGMVRLYKIYGEYKEATTALLGKGDVFGKLSLVEDHWQDDYAEAVTDVRVASVHKAALTEAVRRDPGFTLKLFSSFSERLRQSDEVIESLLHREVSTRLVTLLLNLSDRFGEANGSGTLLSVRLTHQDLANMIASTREAVSKVMSEFQREGMIKVQNRKIVVGPKLSKTFRESSVLLWPVVNAGTVVEMPNGSRL